MHFKLESGYSIVQPIPKEYNVFAYIIKGIGIVERNNNNNKIIERGNLVIFDKYGKEDILKLLKIQKFHLNYY